MLHNLRIVTIDVYGDKRSIIADCVDELQPFIDELMEEEESEIIDTSEEGLVPETEDFFP